MIKPRITGAIITALVIILGIALLYPALRLDLKFTSTDKIPTDKIATDYQKVLLTFNIVNSSYMPAWCYELSKFLQDNKVHSTVFLTGDIAERYPSCVSSFGSDIDIGSSSSTYNNITSIPGYIP